MFIRGEHSEFFVLCGLLFGAVLFLERFDQISIFGPISPDGFHSGVAKASFKGYGRLTVDYTEVVLEGGEVVRVGTRLRRGAQVCVKIRTGLTGRTIEAVPSKNC